MLSGLFGVTLQIEEFVWKKQGIPVTAISVPFLATEQSKYQWFMVHHTTRSWPIVPQVFQLPFVPYFSWSHSVQRPDSRPSEESCFGSTRRKKMNPIKKCTRPVFCFERKYSYRRARDSSFFPPYFLNFLGGRPLCFIHY